MPRRRPKKINSEEKAAKAAEIRIIRDCGKVSSIEEL